MWQSEEDYEKWRVTNKDELEPKINVKKIMTKFLFNSYKKWAFKDGSRN